MASRRRIVLASTAVDVDICISQLLEEKPAVIGLDVEISMPRTIHRTVPSTLQLATSNTCYILQLYRAYVLVGGTRHLPVPPTLSSLRVGCGRSLDALQSKLVGLPVVGSSKEQGHYYTYTGVKCEGTEHGIPSLVGTPLAKLLTNQEIVKVGVGINTDINSLLTYGLVLQSYIDIQAIARLLGIRYSLEALVQRFVDSGWHKDKHLGYWDGELTLDQLHYAADDAHATLLVWQAMQTGFTHWLNALWPDVPRADATSVTPIYTPSTHIAPRLEAVELSAMERTALLEYLVNTWGSKPRTHAAVLNSLQTFRHWQHMSTTERERYGLALIASLLADGTLMDVDGRLTIANSNSGNSVVGEQVRSTELAGRRNSGNSNSGNSNSGNSVVGEQVRSTELAGRRNTKADANTAEFIALLPTTPMTMAACINKLCNSFSPWVTSYPMKQRMQIAEQMLNKLVADGVLKRIGDCLVYAK